MNLLKKAAIAAMMLFGLAACQGNSAYIGQGPLKLSPEVQSFFNDVYMKKLSRTGIAAVSSDGRYIAYTYCPEIRCRTDSIARVIHYCERQYQDSCKVYAIRDKIVWKFDEGKGNKTLNDILKEAKSKQLDTDWFGILDDHPVTMAFVEGRKGELTLASDKTGACSGSYSISNIADGNRYPGEWNLSCDKGQAAKGQLVLTMQNGKKIQFINGYGKDEKGTNVRLYLAY